MEKLDVPQGTLDLMILTILAREPMHGYGISQRLAVLSHDHFHVNPGSLFPSLYRLEQDGKLKAEWRTSENNRRAKCFTASRLPASGSSNNSASAGIVPRSPSQVCWRAHEAAPSAGLGRALDPHRNKAEQDLDDELQSFVDMAAADQIRDGTTPAGLVVAP